MGGRLRNTLLALVLALAALALALEIAARAQARRIVAALSPVATLEYESAGIDLNGRLRLRAPRITFHEGPWPGIAHARVGLFAGGGRFWTLGRMFSGAQGLPLHGSIEMHGLVVSSVPGYAVIGDWLQPPGMVLFEMEGCEGSPLTAADRQRMRVASGERIDRIDYRIDPLAEQLEFEFAFEQPALARVKGSARFTAFKPSLWNDARAQAALRLANAELAYHDPGYLARRNAYCAERNEVTPTQFIEQHITAVDNTLAELGVAPSESVRTLYRNLVSNGGTLTLTILPDADWTPAGFDDHSRADLLRLLNVTARHDYAPPVMLQIAFSTPTRVPEVPLMATGAADPAPSMPLDAHSTPVVSAKPSTVAVVDALPAIVAPVIVGPAAAAQPAVASVATAPVASAPVGPETGSVGPAPDGLGASAPPPPEDSTLALVWQPGIIERLAPREAPVRDYEPVPLGSLAQHAGRRIRLQTKGGKLVDGELRRVEAGQATLLVRVAGGQAEIAVPLSNVREARLVRATPR